MKHPNAKPRPKQHLQGLEQHLPSKQHDIQLNASVWAQTAHHDQSESTKRARSAISSAERRQIICRHNLASTGFPSRVEHHRMQSQHCHGFHTIGPEAMILHQ